MSFAEPARRGRLREHVQFLADGRCVLITGPGGPALPAGEVRAGEDYVLDTVLRVPLETAGFRYQRFHPFALDGNHLYNWIEGAPYSGDRPHRTVPLSFCSDEEAAERVGDPVIAHAIRAAARSYRSQDELAFHADNQRTLEPAYLRGTTPQEGSGFGGDAGEWRQARWHLTEAIAGDGTFLDVGCANGLLMESVAAWCGCPGGGTRPPRNGHRPRLPLRRADQRRRPPGPGAQPDRVDHGSRMIRPAIPPAAFAPKASTACASG